MMSGVSTDISDLMSGLAFERFSDISQHRLVLRKDFVRTMTPTPCPRNSRTKSPQSVRNGCLVFSAVVIDFDVCIFYVWNADEALYADIGVWSYVPFPNPPPSNFDQLWLHMIMASDGVGVLRG